MELDEIDRKLIELLTENGRASYVDLANKVNLSSMAVSERISGLIEEGVIENFTVVVNSQKYGKEVSAFFEVDVEPKCLIEVAEDLADHPNVASIYQMTGPSTLHMHVLVEDFTKLENFINEELYSLAGITRVESHVLLKRFKSRNGLKL